MNVVVPARRRTREAARTWLCPTEAEARRMDESSARVDGARRGLSLLMGVALLALVPWLGWWPFLLATPLGVHIVVVARIAHRWRHPEYAYAQSFFMIAAVSVAAAAITGGPQSPLLPMIVFPVSLLASRFRREVVYVGLAIALVLLAIPTIVLHPQATIADPEAVVITLILVVMAAMITLAFARVEERLREQTHVDPLTGLANRLALDLHYDELVDHSRMSGIPFAVMVLDLDYFKAVNDTHGHDVGDEVLRIVAEVLTGHRREVDVVVRLGGEEFAMVLPDTTAQAAEHVAERQRQAIAERCPAGVPVTVSVGVADSGHPAVAWKDVYRRADDALLAAKRAGRNRVVRGRDAHYRSSPSTTAEETPPGV